MFKSAATDRKQSRSSELENNPYRTMEQSHALKGLLKPFKGKGDYETLVATARALREEIYKLMSDLENRVNRPPYSLLNLTMRIQRQKGGENKYLRWRTKRLDCMGQKYWLDVINDPATPIELLPALHEFERERIALNMQFVELSHVVREAESCMRKFEEADEAIKAAMEINRKKGRK